MHGRFRLASWRGMPRPSRAATPGSRSACTRPQASWVDNFQAGRPPPCPSPADPRPAGSSAPTPTALTPPTSSQAFPGAATPSRGASAPGQPAAWRSAAGLSRSWPRPRSATPASSQAGVERQHVADDKEFGGRPLRPRCGSASSSPAPAAGTPEHERPPEETGAISMGGARACAPPPPAATGSRPVRPAAPPCRRRRAPRAHRTRQ